METNINRAMARIIVAADRAGLPAATTAELWKIRSLTPAGQWEALYRWERCMQTWTTTHTPLAAA